MRFFHERGEGTPFPCWEVTERLYHQCPTDTGGHSQSGRRRGGGLGFIPLPSSSRLLHTTLPSAQGLRISGAYQSACRQNGRPPDESPASVPLCLLLPDPSVLNPR
ncbi:unnamed protein product [Boreogadus saida]